MRCQELVLGLAAAATLGAIAFAGHDAESTIWVTGVNDVIDSGWVLSIPAGPSDFISQGLPVHPGIGNERNLVDGLPITGLAAAVIDFGSAQTFPRVGVYLPNLILDPTGCTPNLAAPVSEVSNPPRSSTTTFTLFDLPEGQIPPGTTQLVSAIQWPPGDPGLLAIGADSTTSPTLCSGFATDAYRTPARIATFLDWGLNAGQDNSTTASCRPSDRHPHGRLRVAYFNQGLGAGDRLTATLRAGDLIDLAFFGTMPGDQLRLFYATAPCTPLVAIGPVLSTVVDGDGDGSFLRIDTTWPSGFGGQTFRFSAVWGNAACLTPGVGFTNCVTVITQSDSDPGLCDDGTIESGWTVQIPSGSSDYFNNHFGNGAGLNGIVGLTISVLDFGTAVPAYPTAGVSNANYGVDASGHTPDLTGAGLLACVCPFTFPPGTFATTSALYISHAVAIAGGALGANVHGWLQFPPGDNGLLGCGADTTSSAGCSYFTMDGYASPAQSFFANWGIRLRAN